LQFILCPVSPNSGDLLIRAYAWALMCPFLDLDAGTQRRVFRDRGGDGLLFINLPLWANSLRALGSKEDYRYCLTNATAQCGKVSEQCTASIFNAETLFAAYLLVPVSCLAYSSVLNIKAVCPSETSWGFIQNYTALQPRRRQYFPVTSNPAPTVMIQHFALGRLARQRGFELVTSVATCS
jgi:hypothetical protein